MYSTSKVQSVCYSTEGGGLFCHVFSSGPLFIRVEFQIKNGTHNFFNINSSSFLLTVIFKTIGQVHCDPNKLNILHVLNMYIRGRDRKLYG